MRCKAPFLKEMRAFLLKMTVSLLAVGTVNFAKMIPAMHAEMITPRML